MQYNATSNAHKLQPPERNILANSKHKQHKSYYLKPCGRITIASLFVISAILLGCMYPQAGEGSVFFIIMALIMAFSKDIKIDL